MTGIRETIRTVGGVVLREFHIDAGTILRSHVHPYDHASFLLSGRAILTVDGKAKPLEGPCMVEIKAGAEHKLFAATDCVWDCIHSLELAQGAASRGDPYVMKGVA